MLIQMFLCCIGYLAVRSAQRGCIQLAGLPYQVLFLPQRRLNECRRSFPEGRYPAFIYELLFTSYCLRKISS